MRSAAEGRDQNGGNVMFKLGLLTSTAMTAVALLLSGTPNEALAQTGMHVANRDANARFLCAYGGFRVAFGFSQQSGYFKSDSERVAVPVIGHGKTVSGITVMEYRNSRFGGAQFHAGIYSENAQGLPGKLIVGGTGKADRHCRPVTISITPTTLKANMKYWVEEKANHACCSGGHFTSLSWAANPNTKHKAYVMTHSFSSSSGIIYSSSTSPWTKQASGAWLRLK